MDKSSRIFNILGLLVIISMLAAPVLAQPLPPTGFNLPDSVGESQTVTAPQVETTQNELPPASPPVGESKTVKVGKYELTQTETGPARYIVMLEDAPLATYRGDIPGLAATHPATVGERKLNVRSSASEAYQTYLADRRAEVVSNAEKTLGRTLKLEAEFFATINGFAAEMTPAEAQAIAQLPNVAVVEREKIYYPQTDAGPEWSGALGVWNGTDTVNGTSTFGEGIIVGIIDTGIDPWNPSFADVGDDGYDHTNPLGAGNYLGVCNPAYTNPDPGYVGYDSTFPCNDKLIGVWGFTESDASPRDTDGHGSHTASTAAGNFVNGAVITTPGRVFTADISGVAPHANIIAYDGCSDGGGCPGVPLQLSRDQALLDGVDVINYSIGGGISTDPWGAVEEQSWLAIRDAGIFVATSAGNSGPGDATLGSPADIPWITSVGANSHNRTFLNSITVTNGVSVPVNIVGESMTGDLITPTAIVFAEDYAGGGISVEDARLCADGVFPAGTFSGEIVICERGEYGRVAKGQTVLDGGAGGYILAQPDEFGGGPGSLAPDPHVLPAVHINYYEYQKLLAYAAVGPITGTIAGSVKDVGNQYGDIMASFSSRGPNSSPLLGDIVVPKVTAPGRAIWAAYSQGEGGDGDYTYNVIQGTSMSSPHVAGAGALLAALHPDWTPQQIESALMLTARNTVLNDDGVNLATPFAQGSGHIDLRTAGRAGLLMDVTEAEFQAANPDDGGDPSTLNLASLGQDQCLGSCSWTREFEATITATWEITAMAFPDTPSVTLTVDPTNFSINAGETQVITVTADVSDVPVGEWAYGTVVLSTTDQFTDSTDIPMAHLPVAVKSVSGIVPDDLSIETGRNAGSVPFGSFQTFEVTDLSFQTYDLTNATLTEEMLVEDPTNGDPYDNIGDGSVFSITVDVPADTLWFVAQVVESAAPDIDLFVGLDTNNDGQPQASEELCASTTPSAAEFCDFVEPDAGTYWVVVQNWDASGTPPDMVKLATVVVDNTDDGNAGNLVIDGPTSVPANTEFDVRVFWDDMMSEGEYWYGAFTMGTDPSNPDNIGLFPVFLHRAENDVTKSVIDADYATDGSAITLTYAITVAANMTPEDLTYILTDTIPAGLTYVPGSATGGAMVSGGVLTWNGVQLTPEREYIATTSSNDPLCSMPLANSGGYVDLEEFGFSTDSTIIGNGTWVDDTYGGGDYNFFGTPDQGSALYFTGEGFVSLNSASTTSGPYTNEAIPTAGLPDALFSILWNEDLRIVYQNGTGENNRGVTTGIQLTAGGIPSAKLLEFDDVELDGDPSSQADYEMVIREAVDDTPGTYEIVYAYDNLTGVFSGSLATGSIGLENAGGTAGVQYAFNDANLGTLENGMAICMDWNFPAGAGAHVITYQVTVDNPAVCNVDFENTVLHSVDNPGSQEESTTNLYTVPCADIALSKTVGLDPATCSEDSMLTLNPGPDLEEEVTYCYTVENIGPYPVYTHTLVDDQLGTLLDGVSYQLDPGATFVFTTTAILTDTTVNSAEWTAVGETATVSDTDVAMVTFEIEPIAEMDTDMVDMFVGIDSQMTHTMMMTNTGSFTLEYDFYEDGGAFAPMGGSPLNAGLAAKLEADTSGLQVEAGPQAKQSTTRAPSREMSNVLYDQSRMEWDTSFNGSPSQVFPDFGFAAGFSADDFTVPTGAGAWTIEKVEALGSYSNGSAPEFDVLIFDSTTKVVTNPNMITSTIPISAPGQLLYVAEGMVPITDTAGNVVLELPEPASFGEGTYWLSVIAVMSFNPGGNQWFWSTNNAITYTDTYTQMFWDASGLFGTPCQDDFNLTSNCGTAGQVPNLAFNLYGYVGAPTCALPNDISWLTLDPITGTVGLGGMETIDMVMDSTGLDIGVYSADVCLTTNDPQMLFRQMPVTMTVDYEPAIAITKTVGTQAGVCATTSEITVDPGTDVYYCYTVENTGNITLPTHDLVDDQLGDLLAGFTYELAPGASVSTVDAGATISATVYQTTTNVAEWTAYNIGTLNSYTATAMATATVNVPVEPVADISVSKTVGTEAGVCATTSEIEVMAGTDVYYCYTVENMGTITLPLHNLVDDQLGTLLDAFAYDLGPGMSVSTVDAGATITATIETTTTNEATWTAYVSGMYTATAMATATVTLMPDMPEPMPAISVSKTVGTEAGVCATASEISVNAGTDVYYCYTVENTGNITLPLHDLVDDQLGTLLDAFAYDLGPGMSVSTVDAGATISATIETTTTNIATWTAYISGTDVSAMAMATATVNVPPAGVAEYGVMVMAVMDTMTDTPGSTVSYQVLITNTGNTTDTFDLTYTGDLGTVTLPFSTTTLAAGASTTASVTIGIPADATAGTVYETTVTATSQGDATVTASDMLFTAVEEAGMPTIYLPIVLK